MSKPIAGKRSNEDSRSPETGGGRAPGEPCREPAHSELVTLQDGKAFTNDRHVAFVEVTKRTGRRAAGYAGIKNFSSITTLLHSHLGNAGKRLAVFFE